MVEHQFQSLAKLEGELDGLDFHSDFVEAAGQVAIAAVGESKPQNEPMHQPGDSGGEAGQ